MSGILVKNNDLKARGFFKLMQSISREMAWNNP